MAHSTMPRGLPATKGTRLAAILKTLSTLTQGDLQLLKHVARDDAAGVDFARCAAQAAQLSVALQEGLIARRETHHA